MRSKGQKYIYYCEYNVKKPYRVIVYQKGKKYELGSFKTYLEALKARNDKLRELEMRIPIDALTRLNIRAAIEESIKHLNRLSGLIKNTDRVSYNTISNQLNQLTKMLNKY